MFLPQVIACKCIREWCVSALCGQAILATLEWGQKYLKSMENVADAAYAFLQAFGVKETTFPNPDPTTIRESMKIFAQYQRVETGMLMRRCE